MFPTIPDKIYKLIIAIGLIISVFFYLESDKIQIQISNNDDKIFELANNLEDTYLKSSKFEKFVLRKSKDISKYYGIENAIEKLNDTAITFTSYIYSNDKNKQRLNDSLVKLWDEYGKKHNELEFKKSNFNNKISKLNKLNYRLKTKSENCVTISFIGFIIFLVGMLAWLSDEAQEDKKKSLSKIEDKTYSKCQSCGIKFSSVRKYGTNNDGTNSNAFCEDCFQNGEFTEPELTLKQVKENAKQYTKGNYFVKRHQLNSLNDLERYNRNKYFD